MNLGIWPARPNRNGPGWAAAGGSGAGFTLLEMLVVLFIAALLITLAVPRFEAGDHEAMRRSALRFRNMLLWIRDQGAYTGGVYRLQLDWLHGRYYCEKRQGEQFVPVTDPLVQPVTIHPDVGRMRWIPGSAAEGVANTVTIPFSTLGPEWPVMVRFESSDGRGYTVSYRSEWPKPRIEEGLQTWREADDAGWK